MAERVRNLRDFLLLTYGVIMGIAGNFLVEYYLTAYPPAKENLPYLMIGMIVVLIIASWQAYNHLLRLR